ncbi:MAG: heme-binding protein, partial [Gemmataceae bacterium]|nr:heme-binding protein [Gemmataceae bacterium]
MRVLSVLLLSAGVASAADVYTQKPEAAPSVEVTALGADPVKPTAGPGLFAKAPQPFWIWGPDQTKGYVLRKEFSNTGVKEARVRVTCDNRFVLFVNGKQVASSTEWQSPVEVDITRQLVPDHNVIEAEVVNDGGQAGFVLQEVHVKDKGLTYIVSDASWTVSQKRNDPKGEPAKLLAKYGDQPWGTVFDGAVAGPGARVPANTFVTLPGFKVEKLFTVPKTELGSWVCMTFDDKGRIIASDQDGKGLCRITPPKPGTTEDTKVERLGVKITAAQGMLFHKGTLYVVCNGGPGS